MKLYTMPMCDGCIKIKKQLKSWDIYPDEIPLIFLQREFPDTILSAPILVVKGNIYKYDEICTREKLWNATHGPDGKVIIDRPQIPQKKKLKIRRIQIQKNKTPTTTINLTPETIAKINVTIIRVINGANINDIVNEWKLHERTAFMIGWRLAQHLKSKDLQVLADMIQEKAKYADPYRHPSSDDDGWQ